MGLHGRDRHYYADTEPYEEDGFDPDSTQDWDDESDIDKSKLKKRYHTRKKLEERIERKKMRQEWDDYEDEINQDFDWEKYKDKD